jgi:hypothetical protein
MQVLKRKLTPSRIFLILILTILSNLFRTLRTHCIFNSHVKKKKRSEVPLLARSVSAENKSLSKPNAQLSLMYRQPTTSGTYLLAHVRAQYTVLKARPHRSVIPGKTATFVKNVRVCQGSTVPVLQ